MVRRLPLSMSARTLLVASIAIVVFSLIAYVFSVVLPPAFDWSKVYRPASHAVFSGKSPYTVDLFTNAPWVLVPFLPLALLPEALGRAVIFILSLAVFAYVAHRLGATPVSMAVFLISPAVIDSLLHANIECMVLLGFVLPPRWGLFLILAKPQMGFTLAIYWLVEAWREGGARRVVEVFGPVIVATLISFVFFGLWPTRWFGFVEYSLASLWPASIPVGVLLLVVALWKRQPKPAMAASPFLSPYVLLHSWVGALVALVSSPIALAAAVLFLWLLALRVATMGG